ncbi:uncharacterized protein LOC120241637 [Hyaena hyaena]|uniref:uncharacterized protein LOC120241637 n=1 Tax=Hyaena hyaena TaxID=95912 RepID=UPI001924BE33|nr:uncharacterized protein LOC120241637 [Hyaena hyaena]
MERRGQGGEGGRGRPRRSTGSGKSRSCTGQSGGCSWRWRPGSGREDWAGSERRASANSSAPGATAVAAAAAGRHSPFPRPAPLARPPRRPRSFSAGGRARRKGPDLGAAVRANPDRQVRGSPNCVLSLGIGSDAHPRDTGGGVGTVSFEEPVVSQPWSWASGGRKGARVAFFVPRNPAAPPSKVAFFPQGRENRTCVQGIRSEGNPLVLASGGYGLVSISRGKNLVLMSTVARSLPVTRRLSYPWSGSR